MNVSAAVLSFSFLSFAAAAAFSQAAGSDYTASLPSVQKVEAQMQGTDAVDAERIQ